MIDRKQVEKFLSMLYPQDIPSGHLLIWTNPGKMSRWTTSTDLPPIALPMIISELQPTEARA
jgi:hypothetical protein